MNSAGDVTVCEGKTSYPNRGPLDQPTVSQCVRGPSPDQQSRWLAADHRHISDPPSLDKKCQLASKLISGKKCLVFYVTGGFVVGCCTACAGFGNPRNQLLKKSYCCSVTQSCPTLCDPMDCSTPGFPVLHYLPEFAQTHAHEVDDAIQPSHPLSPPSPPALILSQYQSLFQWVDFLHQVDKVLKFQLQHQSFPWIFRVDFL